MMLHEELREARRRAGLSQDALAKKTGIPRNQIVRAERGDNITVDTLRKIAVQLPVEQLTLIDTKSLLVDVMPEPERLFLEAAETVIHMTAALRTALTHALRAGQAVEHARRLNPLPVVEPAPPEKEADTMALLRDLDGMVDDLFATYKFAAAHDAKSLMH